MARNNLTSAPPELSCLTQLTELDLSRNELQALHPALCTLKQLQVGAHGFHKLLWLCTMPEGHRTATSSGWIVAAVCISSRMVANHWVIAAACSCRVQSIVTPQHAEQQLERANLHLLQRMEGLDQLLAPTGLHAGAKLEPASMPPAVSIATIHSHLLDCLTTI